MIHPSLPKALTPESLASWLLNNNKEKFSEVRRSYYSDEELIELKDKAVKAGIEINKLTSLKKQISELVDKGTDEEHSIDFHETKGIKALTATRLACEQAVEKGYTEETIQIYGIPNQETRCMDYFDIEGNLISERSRPLSAREQRDYLSPLFNTEYSIKQA